ncbi:RNA polymerase sigma-70 factor, ECF subfamily [Neorhodopirellula lusitana]|uniref:RNA polymerase sigma-70 factor, ECF subfamily n=1 Tax=Neorhodopirellula lusitana TaxID=445327 RepID=A0ABY1PQ15_9BACT|nr:sigma-70 family RNA polymerase sigma factor [Neorhodopirellula lusitana]SMP41209.1 RNA polymerase sigma-70 factor, ECF subfamily [Neorhodopirellula lusitana]
MHDWPDTNDNLIARVKNLSDGDSWSTFMNIYRPAVYRMARERGIQHADAEDLTQQVFVSVSKAIECWMPDPRKPPFRAWLIRITKNQIINVLSRVKPDAGSGLTCVGEILDAIPGNGSAVEMEVNRETHAEAMRWATRKIRDEFSEVTWAMFTETAIDSIPAAEVAKRHGRSVGAVYLARFRVMQRLKEKAHEVSDLWGDAQ